MNVLTLVTVLLSVLSPGLSEAEDRKWVWGGGARGGRGPPRQNNDYLTSAAQAKYEIQEFQEGIEPRPDLKPQDFRPPKDFRDSAYPFLNRPVPIPGPGFGPVPGFGPSGPYGPRPLGPTGPLGPLEFTGAPHGPGFGVNQPPYKHFDHCKCTEKFNCASPGLSYGHCDVGKSYCCYGHGGPPPARPIHSSANGVLVGPGGPIDPPGDGLIGGYGRPGGHFGGPLGGPIGGPVGAPVGGPLGGPIGGPIGGPLGGPIGGPLGGPIGGPIPGGPFGGPLRPGDYGGYGGGFLGRPGHQGGFIGGRPLPGPLGAQPVHSPANGVLVGPGGPYDDPNSPFQRPSPYGPYGRPGGYYGLGRNTKPQADDSAAHASEDDATSDDKTDKIGKDL